MKPALIAAAAAAMLSAPVLPLRRAAPPVPVRRSAVEETDLGRIVWLAKADSAKTLRETKFDFPRPERRIRVMTDPVTLRGGLAALMSASARTMKRGAYRSMALSLASSSGRVVLELRDAGPGLSVHDLADMYGSGGSGLADARRRIERAGGVINVSSEVGAGTVYLIEFPKS